mmetsp:Transcript_42072/g.87739  ORF Transcript_42072/g.87739 Transcript_42072/m.87739 type:complete len:312 (+) Transcript_42072:196-1131(+)
MITVPRLIALTAAIAILDKLVAGVDSFSLGPRTARLTPLSSSLSFRSRRASPSLDSRCPLCYLRSKETESEDRNRLTQRNIQKFLGIPKSASKKCTTLLIRFWSKSRQSVLTLCSVMLFWFGIAGTYTPVSHGSSVSSSDTAGLVSRKNIFSSSLDQIVGTYVEGHMFDDDVYDPVESIYREAMDDRLKGTHPKDLKETISSVLGQNVIKAEKKASGTGFSGVLMKTVGFLRKQGFSEMQAIALLTGVFVIGAPTLVFGAVMQVATQNKRSMNRLMKKRYGETYTVDASEKIEEDVDVPDDDDEDDDDEDE